MNRVFYAFFFLSIVDIAISIRCLPAQHTEYSRAEQLRALGAEHVREIDGRLSYVNLKDSRFSDDTASLIADQQSIVFLSVAGTSITDMTLAKQRCVTVVRKTRRIGLQRS